MQIGIISLKQSQTVCNVWVLWSIILIKRQKQIKKRFLIFDFNLDISPVQPSPRSSHPTLTQDADIWKERLSSSHIEVTQSWSLFKDCLWWYEADIEVFYLPWLISFRQANTCTTRWHSMGWLETARMQLMQCLEGSACPYTCCA